MNICMDVLRMITVKALQGRTWCNMRVFDSPAEPADLRLEKERAPYIGVYIDDGDFPLGDGPGVGVESLYSDVGTCWLLIEVSVAGQGEDAPENPAGEQNPDPSIIRKLADNKPLAYTDAGLELRIGLMARQVMDALSDPNSPWGNLWKRMAVERHDVQIRRGGSGLEDDQQPGVRYASRIIRMKVGLLGEPAPGMADSEFWRDFFALAATDSQVKGAAAVIRQFLEPEPNEPAWLAAARANSWTPEAVRAIGIGPALKTLEGQPWNETPPADGDAAVSVIQE